MSDSRGERVPPGAAGQREDDSPARRDGAGWRWRSKSSRCSETARELKLMRRLFLEWSISYFQIAMTARNQSGQSHSKRNRTAGEGRLLRFIPRSHPRAPGLTDDPGYAAGVQMTRKPPLGPAGTGRHLGCPHPNRPARADPTVDTTSRQAAPRPRTPRLPRFTRLPLLAPDRCFLNHRKA